jgi:hypothetical protein
MTILGKFRTNGGSARVGTAAVGVGLGGGVVGVEGGLADEPKDLSLFRGGSAAGLRSMKVSISWPIDELLTIEKEERRAGLIDLPLRLVWMMVMMPAWLWSLYTILAFRPILGQNVAGRVDCPGITGRRNLVKT